MLNETQIAELDRMWDELFYVAQEPIALTVAFEQIYQFATQDRPDLVNAFEPMRQPINERGDRFRQRLKETEPSARGRSYRVRGSSLAATAAEGRGGFLVEASFMLSFANPRFRTKSRCNYCWRIRADVPLLLVSP